MGHYRYVSWSARNAQIDRVCHCLWSRWGITGMYHGLLEMPRLIECVTAFGPDGALQVCTCIMICQKCSQKYIKFEKSLHITIDHTDRESQGCKSHLVLPNEALNIYD